MVVSRGVAGLAYLGGCSDDEYRVNVRRREEHMKSRFIQHLASWSSVPREQTEGSKRDLLGFFQIQEYADSTGPPIWAITEIEFLKGRVSLVKSSPAALWTAKAYAIIHGSLQQIAFPIISLFKGCTVNTNFCPLFNPKQVTTSLMQYRPQPLHMIIPPLRSKFPRWTSCRSMLL